MPMREWTLAGLACIGFCGLASAQQQASSFFTGVNASSVKNVPIDTSKAIIQKPAQSALSGNKFDLSQLFRKNQVPSFPPKRGISPLPPPSSFPSTKYENFKMVGQPPFLLRWMFGDSKPSPIQPVPPMLTNGN